ncbi:M48 family metallopeptidase [Brachybacterium aquaticum]|uniref:Zn-dependent protease with chaperone function n=1 Tax=Brachybacterium aquaticum TaxID=1432564 RepID=A0A841AHG8_9MICO|nr:M48 family metallopeptidase [Brachybacterium aquaticum]MBB5832730.1 Zn-dependent protease with chaperone function [Brachybacterium aquaticum]
MTQSPPTAPPPPGPYPGPVPSGPTPPAQGRPAGPNLINGATVHGIMGRRRIRHPWELPLLTVAVVISIFLYLAWIGSLVGLAYLYTDQGEEAVTKVWEYIGWAPIVGQLALIIPLLPLIIWWVRAIMYAQLRATSVRMSPTQFPEGYRMVVEAAEQFGLRKVPDAYVTMGNGVINAFASGHGFRRFVVVNSDLFEIGGASRDREALRFVIAHEVGHLAAGHVSYFRLVFANLISLFPILGPAYSRAQEYTADNYGYAAAPAGAPGTMALLSGGKYLNAEVNVHELADRAATDPSFFIHWVNWGSSHPVTTWRAHALRDRSKPGALWIRPRGHLFASPLPPGHVWSSKFPTPAEARAMLDAADGIRPPGYAEQFGRFTGMAYPGRPSLREVQTAAPLLSDRTGYVIPPGPYADDARGAK